MHRGLFPHSSLRGALTVAFAVAALLVGPSVPRAFGSTAAPSGSFQPVGKMIEARDTAQATLLTDGTVLVTGGFHSQDFNTNVVLDTAELFDPRTNQFTAVGPMTSPRVFHQATRLQDGRVLITGGYANAELTPSLRTAELYDPLTRTFTAVAGEMVHGRGGHAASLLPDGRVLVAGGWLNGAPLRLAELFDPATGMFQQTDIMYNARVYPVAVTLPDGRVAILGGLGNNAAPLPTRVEIYDPKTGNFTSNGALKEGRTNFTTALLPDGRILVAGGVYLQGGGLADRQSIEIYDPVTGQSAVVGMLTGGNNGPVGALLPDGWVLVAGGQNANSPALADATLVDAATGQVSPAASMSTPRGEAAGVTLLDGRVLIIGGFGTDGASLDSAEVYVPASVSSPGP